MSHLSNSHLEPLLHLCPVQPSTLSPLWCFAPSWHNYSGLEGFSTLCTWSAQQTPHGEVRLQHGIFILSELTGLWEIFSIDSTRTKKKRENSPFGPSSLSLLDGYFALACTGYNQSHSWMAAHIKKPIYVKIDPCLVPKGGSTNVHLTYVIVLNGVTHIKLNRLKPNYFNYL